MVVVVVGDGRKKNQPNVHLFLFYSIFYCLKGFLERPMKRVIFFNRKATILSSFKLSAQYEQWKSSIFFSACVGGLGKKEEG